MRHLRALAQAGLTHVHLLPAFDIATIERGQVAPGRSPTGDLRELAARLRAAAGRGRGRGAARTASTGATTRATTPCPRAATPPTRTARPASASSARWCRRSTEAGLRVVMDVVYNHTNAAGQNDKSVLDKVVPGYYHRLNADGNIETSTCCQNTATEHAMMEKLMVDSVLTWAKDYKVDGFRFDLMGHHMKRNMLKLRAGARRADPRRRTAWTARKIYLYGEGWNFGEVANNARGVNATQLNMAGTGIGTFNDRLRDGVRGGGPFSGHRRSRASSPASSTTRTASNQGTPADQPTGCCPHRDWIRVGLAGNLRDYMLRGPQRQHRHGPPGRLQRPAGRLHRRSAGGHQLRRGARQRDAVRRHRSSRRRRDTPMAERVRMQNLGVSIVALGQGVPFFHAGDGPAALEVARPQQLQLRRLVQQARLHLPGQQLGRRPAAGAGQPGQLAGHAGRCWPTRRSIRRRRTSRRRWRTSRRCWRSARARGCSGCAPADEVKQHLRFFNTGPSQIPGLIGLALSDPTGAIDHRCSLAVVVFNATTNGVQVARTPCADSAKLKLHPLQQSSSDPVVRTASFDAATCTFSVPARTAAVFWAPRAADQRAGRAIRW